MKKKGVETVLIGHSGHPEVEGTLGQANAKKIHLVSNLHDVQKLSFNSNQALSYVTQTTLAVDETKEIIVALKQKFPHIQGPEKGDLCYATTNRQKAVQSIISQIDLLLVIGSQNSSNSNRLKEKAIDQQTPAYLIDSTESIQSEWFSNVKAVGITSGASAPERLVQDTIQWIQQFDPTATVEEYELLKEDIIFPLPQALRD